MDIFIIVIGSLILIEFIIYVIRDTIRGRKISKENRRKIKREMVRYKNIKKYEDEDKRLE